MAGTTTHTKIMYTFDHNIIKEVDDVDKKGALINHKLLARQGTVGSPSPAPRPVTSLVKGFRQPCSSLLCIQVNTPLKGPVPGAPF